jgi:hypothetical protein
MVLNNSRYVTVVAVFAALHIIMNAMPLYPFRQWAVYLIPIEGIILGPSLGTMTVILGGIISRTIIGADLYSFIYGVTGEAIGVLSAALLVKKRWKIVMAIYVIMLSAYFIHPYGTKLPFWTILDCLVAVGLIYPTALLSKNLFDQEIRIKRFVLSIALISFVSTVAYSLTMIFILIPLGTYTIEFASFDAVYYAFVIGAAGSYIENAFILLIAILGYSPLILILRRTGIVTKSMS